MGVLKNGLLHIMEASGYDAEVAINLIPLVYESYFSPYNSSLRFMNEIKGR